MFSLPGNGATGVPGAMDSSSEGPYSPNDVAGVPEDQAGYDILLWHPGGSVDVASATLTGPGGPVEVRTVDSRSRTPDGGSFDWGGAVVVPVRVLDAEVDYRLDLRFTDGAPYSATFRTRYRDPGLSVEAAARVGAMVVRVSADAPVDPSRVTAAGPGGSVPLRADPEAPGVFVAAVDRPGTYSVCADAGGLGTGFSPAHRCASAVVVVKQRVRLRAGPGRRLAVVAGPAAGVARTATLTFRGRRGRRLARRSFALAGTRVFRRPKGAVTARLTAPATGGYVRVSRTRRFRRWPASRRSTLKGSPSRTRSTSASSSSPASPPARSRSQAA